MKKIIDAILKILLRDVEVLNVSFNTLYTFLAYFAYWRGCARG